MTHIQMVYLLVSEWERERDDNHGLERERDRERERERERYSLCYKPCNVSQK